MKFKILYLSSFSCEESKILFEKNKPIVVRVLLKVISLTSLKEVLPGKFKHRLIFNYFKKFIYKRNRSSILENNILLLDSSYLSTLGLSHIYNLPIRDISL